MGSYPSETSSQATARREIHELDKILKQDVKDYPWPSPTVFVKKDGASHFCVNFRKSTTSPRKIPSDSPGFDDTLDTQEKLNGFRHLQVEVDPNDNPKTAFLMPFGLYQFRVMPLGLCNAPATFNN